MSIARHHAEWLSLLEVSGPFLSMPVLLRAFPQGLDADDPALAGELRAAYEEWADAVGSDDFSRPARFGTTEVVTTSQAIHTAWIRYVLQKTLALPADLLAEHQGIAQDLKATLSEHGETLRPDLVLVAPETRQPRLLIQVYPAGQALDKTLPSRPWKANPATRLMELLRQTGVRLGLATNGEAWLLVSAKPGETTSYITWYASLWGEERLTLRALRSLLGVRRFFSVPDDQTLEALLDASAVDQQEVTDQLGYQVRRAVEILVASLDQADQDRGRTLLAGVDESVLYEAALTVMMRLVFLLSAEERGLLLLGDPLYDQHYAASALRAQLHELADQLGEEVLERRFDAWSRLLALFRAVHGGVQHENLRLPAYGGSLFDPDRFPLLEGRAAGTSWRETPAQPLPINNRTVLHLLDALQVLQVRVPGGGPAEARRLSFRALDIEQIGHVYEGLLDHTAVRATEPILGLAGTRDREPEIPLARLEAFGNRTEDFINYLKEQTGRSESALRKALSAGPPSTWEQARLRAVCGNDEVLYQRVLPFAGLVRNDDFGQPIVIPAGSVYVTAGTDRRSSGTHYTPRSLTEPIVEHTLEPLVYAGPAEGWPRAQWQLRSPAELLDLKVCDMAMGSGAFLVQADRYLAERLVEAWDTGGSTGDPNLTLPADPDDRLILARRLVAERCLYGVDKNPLAVEMAKLSLWLVTLSRERPFTFLDHALRSGDSLLGIDVDQLTSWSLTPAEVQTIAWFTFPVRQALDRALALRRKLAAILEKDVHDAEVKQHLLAEASETMDVIRLGADLLLATALADPKQAERLRQDLLARYHLALATLETVQAGRLKPHAQAESRAAIAALRAEADGLLAGQRPFHWALEYPEVFEGGGFHAFVGNPPFLGGQRISGTLGEIYLRFLKTRWSHAKGSADLCAYFFLRAFDYLKTGGASGLIATNTIAQGDTRELGLDHIAKLGGVIYWAAPWTTWPGVASVSISVVHIAKHRYDGARVLSGQTVSTISVLLDDSASLPPPKRLMQNAAKSFMGSTVLGEGFVLEPAEAKGLIIKDPRNANILFPYLNGDDLNSRPDQSASRWVINFFDWSLNEAGIYPDCLQIVRERVLPERENNKYSKSARELWWQYERKRPELYDAIASLRRVLVVALTSKYLSFSFVPTKWVFAHACGVVSIETSDVFAVLQSSHHDAWARKFSSSLATRAPVK